MGDLGQRRRVFDTAEKVRLLHDDAGRLIVDRGGQVVGPTTPCGVPTRDQLDAEICQVCGERVAIFGMHAGRARPRCRTPVMLTAISTASADGAAAVVEAGVRHIHPGKPCDQRLILEHHLQVALARFGLVGRVRRVELAARGDRIDHGRDEMVVAPAAQEADLLAGVRVLGGHGGKLLRQFHLRQSRGDI